MSANLSDEERSTLRGILAARRSVLLSQLDSLGRNQLPREIYVEMQSAVGDEFVASGLGANDEPNARGLMLEEIIDKIGRLRDAR